MVMNSIYQSTCFPKFQVIRALHSTGIQPVELTKMRGVDHPELAHDTGFLSLWCHNDDIGGLNNLKIMMMMRMVMMMMMMIMMTNPRVILFPINWWTLTKALIPLQDHTGYDPHTAGGSKSILGEQHTPRRVEDDFLTNVTAAIPNS